MMTSPLADMLTRIRNALAAGHDKVSLPKSTLKLSVLKILKEEGFIKSVSVNEAGDLSVDLKYTAQGQPVIEHIQLKSKPGRRIYVRAKEMKPVRSGLGIGILTTPKGVLTDKKAAELNVGGELICEVW